MEDIYLLTGSNLGDRMGYLDFASGQIQSFSTLVSYSSVYESGSWGYESKNFYLNQCLYIRTDLNPLQLLYSLKKIEAAAGRTHRDAEYEDRVLDIDILFYGSNILESQQLKIPHPRLHLRAFALFPLSEIAADLIHPVSGKTIGELLASCPDPVRPVRY